MNRRPLACLVVLTLLSLAAAGCTGPAPGALDEPVGTQAVAGGAGGGGGAVANSAPAITAFAADRTAGENDGSLVVVFSGAAFDRNTEQQIQTLRVAAAGPVALASNHSVTAAERTATTEPAGFGADGWKVWTDAPRDGVLRWKYRQSFPAFTPAGAYEFRAGVADAPGATGASDPLTVTLAAFSLVTVSGPVDLQGAPLAGQAWGGWLAEAGARDVAAANYLKIVNDGASPTATVVVDFTEAAFAGAEDANFSVPLDGNVQFAWFEDDTPATTSPAEKPFVFAPASPDGAVTVRFTGQGNVVYVTYRIAQLPDVLPVQAYHAAFTVTEL